MHRGPAGSRRQHTCESPATYALTQADINAGRVDNTATATGVAAAGANPSASDAETAPVTKVAAIDLTKTVGTPTTSGGRLAGSTDAGDTVTYTFTVKNTSNVTLTSVGITDTKLGLSDLTCGQSTLAPGQTVTCTRSYALTQADIDGRAVDNTATATGHDPQNAVVTDTDTANLPLTPQSSIALDKVAGTPTTANGAKASATDAGDTITYDFVVTNTGATSLTAITVTDTKLGLTNLPCAAGPLAPGQSATCRATYPLTQADIDAGKVDNTASTTAASPTGPVTATDSATVAITPVNAVTLTKTGSPVVDGDSNGPDAGDTVTYTFRVRNTGTTTLTPVDGHRRQARPHRLRLCRLARARATRPPVPRPRIPAHAGRRGHRQRHQHRHGQGRRAHGHRPRRPPTPPSCRSRTSRDHARQDRRRGHRPRRQRPATRATPSSTRSSSPTSATSRSPASRSPTPSWRRRRATCPRPPSRRTGS